MNDDLLLIQLRDCFTAGYTLPQFCIDNDIKRPLFVAADQNRLSFLWEIHVQFCYDKRMTANFALVFGKVDHLNLCPLNWNVAELKLNNISEINLLEFDKIIVFDTRRLNPQIDKAIYLDELLKKFCFRTYDEIPLLNFMQNHKGVKLFVMNHPMIRRNEHNTEHEKKLMPESKENITLSEVRKRIKESNGKKIPTPYDFLGYTNQEVYELLEEIEAIVNLDGSTYMQDRHNKIVSIFNGKRLTANQPEHYKHKIYFVGNCVYFGWGVPYDKTVESHLQDFLNENNLPYRVENESQFLSYRYQDIFFNLNKLPVKEGDIIFVTPFNYCTSTCFPFIDTNPIFFRPHNYGEVFADGIHINELGHKALAEKIFEFLTKNNFFHDVEFKYPAPPPPFHRYGIPTENSISPSTFSQNKELEEYKKKLREKRLSVGAIVMNCNPFTLGHEYLIEYASKKVKKLFIFVVEEDKSEFKFADRFKLVQAGVKKFSNVEVLPSGKFIISQKTFSGYFNKENLQDVAVDSSEDVEIFAREIAPSLGITVRFVGEEPEDTVTRQYNDNMRRILPQYNIDFCEIPRREINGEIISAKKVREALHKKDFDTIKKLVPKTTLKFLRDNFSKKNN